MRRTPVSEGAGEGTGDRIFTSVSYALGAGVQVEKMSTVDNTGATALNLTGSELANVIFGNAGANTLDGKGGADVLLGLGGDDFYFVDNAGDTVSEGAGEGTGDRIFASVSYTLGAGVKVKLLSTDSTPGTSAISLTRNQLANILAGNAGANTLDGVGGAEAMFGSKGDDFYFVDTASDQVFEAAGEGSDRVFASASFALTAGQEVEKLTSTDNGAVTAINLTGNELANTIFGNAGGNTLDGKGGSDTLFGFGGNDTYVVDNLGDVVVESAGEGTSDTVLASVNYALAAGVQVEVLGATDATATTPLRLSGN